VGAAGFDAGPPGGAGFGAAVAGAVGAEMLWGDGDGAEPGVAGADCGVGGVGRTG